MLSPGTFREKVVFWLALIPRGKAVNYGQLAALAGFPGRSRQVGYVLATLPHQSGLPWHRVLNAKGEISPRRGFGGEAEPLQKRRLEAEGVRFVGGRIAWKTYRWQPDLTALEVEGWDEVLDLEEESEKEIGDHDTF